MHVGQVLYSNGFKFGEKGQIKIFGRFLPTGPALLNFIKILSLSTHNLIDLGPPPQFLSQLGRSPTQGDSNLGKTAYQNFGPFLPTGPALLNFIKILSLFNKQPNRPRASPAIFKHVGQVPYSRGFKFGEKG